MSPKGPIIRDVTGADAEPVRRFVHGILAEFGLQPDTDGIDADLMDPASAYADGVFDLILDDDGRLAGTAALKPLDADTAEIRKMYFAPHIRGRGWGRLELERLLALARSRGHLSVQLETANVLTDAITLYRRFGFVDAATQDCSPRCDLHMTLTLQPDATAAAP